eukprot:s1765_g13.t1
MAQVLAIPGRSPCWHYQTGFQRPQAKGSPPSRPRTISLGEAAGLFAVPFTCQRRLSRRGTRRTSAGAWKQKHLAMRLSELPRHPARNPKLEQYATDGDTAACWLMGIDKQDPFADLDEAVVDLGAGNGILGIGALLLGAPRAIFVEVDEAVCKVLDEALENEDLRGRAQILQKDVADVAKAQIDAAPALVLMNPPWGQQRRSADRPFLEASIAMSPRAVHLMHSSGAVHVEPWAKDMGWHAVRWLEMDFPLPRTYAHQSKRRGSTTAAIRKLKADLGAMAETSSSPGIWERFLTASRPKGDLASLDFSGNPTGLPRRRAPEHVDLEILRGSGNVRRALSESPAPLSTRESAMESARRRSKTPLSGYGERSPPCSARGNESEVIEAGDLPRRRLSELAIAMQSGQGVRDALSPPVRRLRRGSPPRRSRTAEATVGMAPSVLCGYGERSVPPKRQLTVRDEGVEIRDKGRASSGIPWRCVPMYDDKGLLVHTGITGGTFETEVPLRSVTPYSQRLWSGDGVKDLMTPERPRHSTDPADNTRDKAGDGESQAVVDTAKSSVRGTAQSAGRPSRAVAMAISKAARASDQQLESERSRCLAKFDRLCTPSRSHPSQVRPAEEAWGRDTREIHDTFRPKRRVAAQPVTQPFSTDETPAPASPAPRRIAPQMMPSTLFLGEGPDPLRGSDRHAAARRTWQLEMEMAKIAFAAGRVAVATCSPSDSIRSSRPASRPQSRPRPKELRPTKPEPQKLQEPQPQVIPPTTSSPAIIVKHVDETKPAKECSPLEEKASPQAVGKVVEMIDKIIGKELDIPKSQPESEGFITPPTARETKASMEPEPESATSPSSPYPRLLSCAAERVPSVAKQEKAPPVARKQIPANAKGRHLHQGRRPTLRC